MRAQTKIQLNWGVMMDNLNPMNLQRFDQANSMLQEMLPTMWWSLFNESVKKGFTREEALRLVMSYTRATFGKDSDNDS